MIDLIKDRCVSCSHIHIAENLCYNYDNNLMNICFCTRPTIINTSLKLFVWEDVLREWTAGMICVLARTESEAISLIAAKNPEAFNRLTAGSTKLMPKPRVVTEPEAFIAWGGM